MSTKISFETIAAGCSRPDKVWQLGERTANLFTSAAEVATALQYHENTHDEQAARQAIARIGALIETLAEIRKEDESLKYFALAYQERLGGTYIIQDQGKSYVEQREGDNRPREVEPLEYRYRSYADKALELIQRMLEPLLVAGSNVGAAAAALPYLLELTFDQDLVARFVAELRQEAVHASRLAMSEAGMGMNKSCDPEGQRMSNALEREIGGISDSEVCVLKCLQVRKPALLKIEDIMDATGFSRDTVLKVVKGLIEQKLAHRPKGERKGATLTENGLLIATRINSGIATLNSH